MTTTTPEQARTAGYQAFERGKKVDDWPNYGMGEAGYQLRKAWRAGWNEANVERGRKVAR